MNKDWYISNNEESIGLDVEALNKSADGFDKQFIQDQDYSYNPWDTYQNTSYDTQDISQFAPKESRNITGKTIGNCHLVLIDDKLYLYIGYVKEMVANFKVNKVQKITVGDKAIGQLGGIYGYYIEFGNETKGIFTMEDLKPQKLGEKLKLYKCNFDFSIKEKDFYDLLGDLIGILSKDFEEYKLFYNVGWHDKKYSFPNNDINLEFPLYKKNFAYKNSDKSVYNLKATVKLYNKIKEEDIRLLLLGTLISGVLHTRLKRIGRELNKIVLINAPQSDTRVLTELYLKMFDYNIGNIALSSKENMIEQLIANTKDDVAVIDGNNESGNNQTVKNNIKKLEDVFCSGIVINYSDTRKEWRVCSSASNLVIFANKISDYMNTENYIYLEISDDLGIEMEDINKNKLLWGDMMKLFIDFCEKHIETLFLNRPHIPENVDDKYKGCYATYWYALTTFEGFLQEYKLEGLEKTLELSKNYLDIISDFFSVSPIKADLTECFIGTLENIVSDKTVRVVDIEDVLENDNIDSIIIDNKDKIYFKDSLLENIIFPKMNVGEMDIEKIKRKLVKALIEANILEPESENAGTKKITICGERVRCRVLLKDKLPKIFSSNEKADPYGNMFSIGLTDSKKEMFTSNMGNGHIFITGISGFGKTHLLCNIITQAHFKGMPVIVISINNQIKIFFEGKKAEKIFGNNYQVYNLKTKTNGIPINPFMRYANETETATIERIVSLLSVNSLGVNQKKELKNAIEKSLSKDNPNTQTLCKALKTECINSSVAERLSEKIAYLETCYFSGNKSWNDIFYGKECDICIFQLPDSNTGKIVADMILEDMFGFLNNKSESSKPKDIMLVIDEIQKYNTEVNSPIAKILTEGRGIGINCVYATQYESNFTGKALERLQQANTQISFVPTKKVINRLSNKIGKADADIFSKLQVGECIVMHQQNKEMSVKERRVKTHTFEYNLEIAKRAEKQNKE